MITMPNDMRDRLVELISDMENELLRSYPYTTDEYRIACLADYLIENGVILTPFIAMVERFIKDGKFDKKRTTHNGRIAVVYIDKNKWACPLIDITSQFYNTSEAYDRICEITREDAEKSLREREGE